MSNLHKIVNGENETIDKLDLLSLFDAEKALCTCVNNGQDAYITDSDYTLRIFYIEGINQGFEAFDTGVTWNGAAIPFFNYEQANNMLKILVDVGEVDCIVDADKTLHITLLCNDEVQRIKPNNDGLYEFSGWLFT